MKTLKNSEGTRQKPDRKTFNLKYKVISGSKAEGRKQDEKFDKDCLSETDMDEILAIC